MDKVGALLLAAGQSQRMGSLKALLSWNGTTLLRHQICSLDNARLDPILLVLGHRSTELQEHIKDVKYVQTVLNPDYKNGRTASIKVGLSAIKEHELDAVLILNVDQPRTSETLELLVKGIPCFQNDSESLLNLPLREK